MSWLKEVSGIATLTVHDTELLPSKPPVSERICQLCQLGTGNEPHFLLKCPVLNERRQDMLTAMADADENFTTLSDKDKTVLTLNLCASHPAVSNSIYCMYRESVIF